MLALPLVVGAQTTGGLPTTYSSYGYNDPLGGVTVPQLIGRVIAQVLPFVGTLFLVMFLYGGYQYFSSQGEAKKVESARKTLTNAVIGMTIVMASYALTSYVITNLGKAVGQ